MGASSTDVSAPLVAADGIGMLSISSKGERTEPIGVEQNVHASVLSSPRDAHVLRYATFFREDHNVCGLDKGAHLLADL